MPYDFNAAFDRIERELIDSMMRNLRRYHLDWEEAEGFDWSQWQVEQLAYLEEYRKANADKFGLRFTSINAELEAAIQHAYDNGQKEEELRILEALAKNNRLERYVDHRGILGAGDAFFRVNDRKVAALLTATRSDMERAEWAVLRRADDQYRRIIFDAQMYANTGAGTVEKAVDMATKDFMLRGIDCIEYRNGARHTIHDYADMAIRTAERRAMLYGEGQKRQEWGVALVEVVMPGGNPCPQCARWRGKILVDDVYSGGRPDGKHQLLSEAMAQGFLHPRCKDSVETFFPWEDEPTDKPMTPQELREAERAEAEEEREQHASLMAEKWQRVAGTRLDPGNRRTARAHAEAWRSEGKPASYSLADIAINRGVGAKGKNYDILDPRSGLYYNFIEGTRIQNIQVFAGYGTRHPLSEEVAEGLAEQLGGSPSKWQHCKGRGHINVDGEDIEAEVHWFQEESVGKHKFKVKKWLEDES